MSDKVLKLIEDLSKCVSVFMDILEKHDKRLEKLEEKE